MLRVGQVSKTVAAFGLSLFAMSAWAEVYRFGVQDVVAILEAGDGLARLEGAAKPEAEPGTDAPTHAGGSSVRIMATRLDGADQSQPGASQVRQLAPGDILRQLPAVLGIVPGTGVATAPAVDPVAVFAADSPSTEGRDSISVTLEPTPGEVFRVAATDHDGLAAWLGARSMAFFAGDMVLERVDGFDGPVRVVLGTEPAVATESQPPGMSDGGLGDLVGRSLAEVSFATLDGGTQRFRDLSDSILLVHIWATWCAPCLADMPILEALEDAHAGLRVVNLSDESADVIKAWLAENPTGMLHGRRDDFAFLDGDGAASRDGAVMAVRPVHLVLDREGRVLEAGAGGGKGSSASNHLAEMVEPYL